MTDQHPITPPPKRFKQWEDDIFNERDNVDHVLDCAWRDGFQTGADQEQVLEAQQRMLYGGVTREDWELVRRALEALDD